MNKEKEKIIFTVRTDKKQMLGQSPFLYVKKAILFKSNSNGCTEYAKEHGVWQVHDKKANGVELGDRVFLKDISTGIIWDLGSISSISIKDPIENWPGEWGITEEIKE
jgi:hypothetical protein